MDWSFYVLLSSNEEFILSSREYFKNKYFYKCNPMRVYTR